jgi:hypothetical protein
MLAFLLASIVGNIQMYNVTTNSPNYGIISVVQGIFYIFFTYYFYYLMVFLVAASVAQWYFRNTTGCCTGFTWSLYHIGTLTYAAVMITIIKILQMFVNSTQKTSSNTCVDFCICCVQSCVQCCLSCL